jgi:hypothetical protein
MTWQQLTTEHIGQQPTNCTHYTALLQAHQADMHLGPSGSIGFLDCLDCLDYWVGGGAGFLGYLLLYKIVPDEDLANA